MRGATVKLIRSIPWWTIPCTKGNSVMTQKQKRRFLRRAYPTAGARGAMRNAARYEGWFKDGKWKRIHRDIASWWNEWATSRAALIRHLDGRIDRPPLHYPYPSTESPEERRQRRNESAQARPHLENPF